CDVHLERPLMSAQGFAVEGKVGAATSPVAGQPDALVVINPPRITEASAEADSSPQVGQITFAPATGHRHTPWRLAGSFALPRSAQSDPMRINVHGPLFLGGTI